VMAEGKYSNHADPFEEQTKKREEAAEKRKEAAAARAARPKYQKLSDSAEILRRIAAGHQATADINIPFVSAIAKLGETIWSGIAKGVERNALEEAQAFINAQQSKQGPTNVDDL